MKYNKKRSDLIFDHAGHQRWLPSHFPRRLHLLRGTGSGVREEGHGSLLVGVLVLRATEGYRQDRKAFAEKVKGRADPQVERRKRRPSLYSPRGF